MNYKAMNYPFLFSATVNCELKKSMQFHCLPEVKKYLLFLAKSEKKSKKVKTLLNYL